MWQLPILVLAGIIISSTSLIIDSTDTIQKLRDQDNDNTFYNNNRDLRNNINCNNLATLIDADATLCKIIRLKNFVTTDNNNIVERIFKDVKIKKDLNYNGKGFRKEQWHNYPRQLDRLQSFLYKRHKPDYGEKEYVIENDSQTDSDASKTFKILLGSGDNDLNTFESNEIGRLRGNEDNYRFDSIIAASSPLMILKLQLAAYALTNNGKKNLYDNKNMDNTYSLTTNMDRENPTNVLLNLNSLHWDQNTPKNIDKPNEELYTSFKSLPSKKRMFSIWSRVQSMNPKSHELHHRRFLHAYYAGLPTTSDGSSGILSAETRAMIRPPGSPLRWG